MPPTATATDGAIVHARGRDGTGRRRRVRALMVMDGHAGVLALLLLRVSTGPGHRHSLCSSLLSFVRCSAVAWIMDLPARQRVSLLLTLCVSVVPDSDRSMASCNFAARLSLIMLPTY